VNDVSLWANNNQMAWIMKITKRLQEAPNFRRPVSRAQPLREQFSTKHKMHANNSLLRSKDLQKLTQVKILPKTSSGDGKKKIDLVASMHMLKLQCLTDKMGKTAWSDLSSMHVPDKAALSVLHSQIMAQELRTLNSKFVSSLQNNLFRIKPRTGRHGDRLQLLYPLLYGPHIDALLQDNEEELDNHVWFDKP